MTGTKYSTARSSFLPVVGLALAAAGYWLLDHGFRRLYRPHPGPDREKCRALLETIGAGVTAGIYDHVSQAAKEERAAEIEVDVVVEAGDDSFPCSDPPSFSPRSEAA